MGTGKKEEGGEEGEMKGKRRIHYKERKGQDGSALAGGEKRKGGREIARFRRLFHSFYSCFQALKPR
jgi:hypothetical protein